MSVPWLRTRGSSVPQKRHSRKQSILLILRMSHRNRASATDVLRNLLVTMMPTRKMCCSQWACPTVPLLPLWPHPSLQRLWTSHIHFLQVPPQAAASHHPPPPANPKQEAAWSSIKHDISSLLWWGCHGCIWSADCNSRSCLVWKWMVREALLFGCFCGCLLEDEKLKQQNKKFF